MRIIPLRSPDLIGTIREKKSTDFTDYLTAKTQWIHKARKVFGYNRIIKVFTIINFSSDKESGLSKLQPTSLRGNDMKRASSIIIICFILFGFISCQKKINSGLIAYYPFNGDARDYSGNDNHGVVDGPVLTTDRFGKENCAYSFDGEKATIEAYVQGMPAIDSPQSFSWWFKINTDPTYINKLGADNMIALVDSGKSIGIQFGFRAPGYNSLGLDTWNWGGGTLLEAEQPTVRKWHHCVYTYDGLTHRFYINGAEESNSTAKTQQDVPILLMFGNYPSGDQYFTGEMDDIRIYNRNLNQDEINILFNEGK